MPDHAATQARLSLLEHVRSTGIALAAFVVTVLEWGLMRRTRPIAVESETEGLSDLALVVLGLLRLAPQVPDDLATQLGLRADEVDALLVELAARGYVERRDVE